LYLIVSDFTSFFFHPSSCIFIAKFENSAIFGDENFVLVEYYACSAKLKLPVITFTLVALN
jgi:hypothetical protein